MSRQVVSRSQRRLEKKQTLVLIVLGLVIALGSFGLGVMVGRSGGEAIVEEDLTVAGPIAIPAAGGDSENVVEQPAVQGEDPELTFYDTLPENEQPPMGSGINIPEQEPPVPVAQPAVAAEVAQNPAPQATQPVAKPTPAPVAVVKPAAPVSAPAPVVAEGAYVIQVASSKNRDRARNLSSKLSAEGYSAFVEEADLGAKGVWFRVYVGPFASLDAARGTASKMEASRLVDSTLVKKR